MSIEVHIFMQDSRIPTCAVWQREIDQTGFPLVLDPTLDVRKHTGFWPATYCGQSTGFEFYLEPLGDIVSTYPHIADRVGAHETCATFRWGGDLVEMSAALSAAASLAKLADGVYFYPDDDIICGCDEAVEAIRKDLCKLGSE